MLIFYGILKLQDDDDDMFLGLGGFDFGNMKSMFDFGGVPTSRNGPSCKTITQKVGNIVTTFRQCS